MPLLWRVFATNAAVLIVATLALAISPVTISFPIALTEVIVLAVGMVVMLAVALTMLRRAFGPLRRLAAVMRGVDPLRPGERAVVVSGDPEVMELTTAFNEMLARLEAERRESARRALSAQEGERLRIARELHDEVGQVLTGVLLQLEALGEADPAVRPRADEAKQTVRRALEEARRIAQELRPALLEHLGLVSALTEL